MGWASDTCSIKGIRGDLTTSLSASWPHIDQPVWDHSQPVWQLNRGPTHAHVQTLSFSHTHSLTCAHAHSSRIHSFTEEMDGYVDVLWILHRCKHVQVSKRGQSKRRKGEVVGGLDRFHSLLTRKQMVFFQFTGETRGNQIARIDLKAQFGAAHLSMY